MQPETEQPIKLYPAILMLYEDLYRQATVRPATWCYKLTDSEVKMTVRFIKWLQSKYTPEQITGELLVRFFEFQFSRYMGVITPSGRNSIMLNWVIGNKARTAWEQRTVGKHKKLKYKIKQELQLKLKSNFSFKVNTNNSVRKLKLNKHEEVEKQKYFNTEVGYLYCADMTTLYTPLSNLCSACNFKDACLQRLQLNFPYLYKQRLNND